jgi:structural maintenance of chromosome 1
VILQNNLRAEHYLWQLFQVEEDLKGREVVIHQLQEEKRASAAKEQSLLQMFKDKKKEHNVSVRDIMQCRERIQQVQNELERLEPRMIQLREQARFSQKRILEAEATEKNMRSKSSGKEKEVEALKIDLAELNAAKAELDAKQNRRISQGGDQNSLVLEGARLEEYHRIKEAAQVKTNSLRSELDSIMRLQTADLNKVETLSQELSDRENEIAKLTDEMKQADERIINVSASSCLTCLHCQYRC